jgi:hypothetical protein
MDPRDRLPPSRTAAPGGSGESDFLFMTRREEAGNEEEEYPRPEWTRVGGDHQGLAWGLQSWGQMKATWDGIHWMGI